MIYYSFERKDRYEKIKDNLRSENEKYVSNDTSCNKRIKIKDLREKLLSILWVMFKCN